MNVHHYDKLILKDQKQKSMKYIFRALSQYKDGPHEWTGLQPYACPCPNEAGQTGSNKKHTAIKTSKY